LRRRSTSAAQKVEEALNHAARRGVIVVAAAGNEATLGSSIITRHRWVIPVVACDVQGRPINESNLLQARDPADIDLLVEAIRPAPGPKDFSLTGVDVRCSPLSSTRNIVDVIFS
jgi:hypothetical protein